jgi:hypothetical protein
MISIATAIQSLSGNVEFTMVDNDLTNIQWNSEPAKIPTEKEIKDEYKRLMDLENAKKADLLVKLGITADEAALLLK